MNCSINIETNAFIVVTRKGRVFVMGCVPVHYGTPILKRGRIIAFTSGKGGVGKTTISSSLAMLLSKMKKKDGKYHEVLLLDLDTGLRNIDVILGIEDDITWNLHDVLSKGFPWKQAIVKPKVFPNLSVLVTAQQRSKEELDSKTFSLFLQEVLREYDYIIIDCPAGIEYGFRLAVENADEAIVVSTPEYASLRCAEAVVRLLAEMKVAPVSCILNKFDPDFYSTEEEAEQFLGRVIRGTIPSDDAVRIAGHEGEPIVFKQSPASLALKEIAQTIFRHIK